MSTVNPEPRTSDRYSEAATKALGVLIIGCGYWGRNYVRVFSEMKDTEVVAVCDRSLQSLDLIAGEYPQLTFVQDVNVALTLPDVDCAIVATPATTHHRITSLCLEAGIPVMVEKPLTTHAADAAALVELADRRGVTLMVGHTFVYNAAIQKVRHYIESNALGDIYYMYARRTSLGPIRTDVNALWDLASHDVAIFNYLMGAEPEWVSAVGSRVLHSEREDVGFVSVGYPGDIVAHIHVSWTDPTKTRELVVVGSDKQVVFNDLNALERVRVYSKGVTVLTPPNPSYGEFMYQLRDGDIVSPLIEGSEPLKNECAHFVECVMTGARPLTDGNSGGAAVRVMEAIDSSIAQGGTPVSLSNSPSSHDGNVERRAYAVR